MQHIETLLNTLPDGLAMALVLFVLLYLVYLCLATIAYLFLRGKHRFTKLALLPLTATSFVVIQLFSGVIEAFNSPTTNGGSNSANTSDRPKSQSDLYDFENRVLVDPDLTLSDDQFFSEGPCK